MTRLYYCFCSIVLLTLFTGCGSGNVGLRGTVTFSDDGSPVTTGTVAFRKDGRIARGDIKGDGTYIVGFERESDGLPPGKYEVFIAGTDKVTVTVIDEEKGIYDYNYEPLIDRKYESPETSGLTVEVDSSTKIFHIQVDRSQRR